MWTTPAAVTRTARLALAPFGIVCALVLIGPLAPLLADGGGATAMLAAAFSGLIVAMLAWPWRRRTDLLMGAIILVAGAAILRHVIGLGGILGDGWAGLIGALGAYLAVGVERLRRQSRDYGDMLFEVIEIEDRRVARRVRAQAGDAGRPASADRAPRSA